jgi:hypothetical protein
VIKTKVKITKYLSSLLLLQVYIVVFFIVPNIFRWLTTSKGAHNSTVRVAIIMSNNMYMLRIALSPNKYWQSSQGRAST